MNREVTLIGTAEGAEIQAPKEQTKFVEDMTKAELAAARGEKVKGPLPVCGGAADTVVPCSSSALLCKGWELISVCGDLAAEFLSVKLLVYFLSPKRGSCGPRASTRRRVGGFGEPRQHVLHELRRADVAPGAADCQGRGTRRTRC